MDYLRKAYQMEGKKVLASEDFLNFFRHNEEWLEDKSYFLVDVNVSPDDKIVVEIDHAEGVKAGGKLALQIRKLKVKALYNVIPERLVVDVTPLGSVHQ